MAEEDHVYVKAVPGAAVRRFGTSSYLGAVREPGRGIIWTEGEVVALPLAHWRRYVKEYTRAVADESLKVVTRADYDAWVKQQADASAKDAPNPGKKKAAPAEAAEPEPTPDQ